MKKLIIIVICLVKLTFFVNCEVNNEQPATCEWEGFKGKCVPASNCLTTLDRRGAKPPTCENNGVETGYICCTDCELVNDTSNFIISPSGGAFWKDGRKARDACLQYLKDLPHICRQEGFYGGIKRRTNSEKRCHNYSMWGVGGSPPPNAEPPRENPYEALIGYGNDLDSASWLFAGAIISDKFILTSAVSLKVSKFTYEGRIEQVPLKYVALGVKNRKSDKATWQIRNVKSTYQHPDFHSKGLSDRTLYNNIALLELETPITFNKDVLPACLPEPTEDFDTSNAKFSTWKDKDSNLISFFNTSTIITVQELSAEECDVKIREAGGSISKYYADAFPEQIKAESQLCYGNTNTCLNVMGAPITVTTQYSRCMNTVVGVQSYSSTSCGPTVFTKVKHSTAWIESIVWP